MPQTLFIDTNTLPRVKGAQGEFTEILNNQLTGAKNVVGTLRWLDAGESFDAVVDDRHQLIYLMEGSGSITLEGKTHDVAKGMGVYLGLNETATIHAAPGASVKLLHLVVPQIPK